MVSQRKPEESPVKEGAVKKVKQDDTQPDGVQEPRTNGVDKANTGTKSMEVERSVFALHTKLFSSNHL